MILTNTVVTGVTLLSKLTSQLSFDIILGLNSCQLQFSMTRTESWFWFFPFSPTLCFFPSFSISLNIPQNVENLWLCPNTSILSKSAFSQISHPVYFFKPCCLVLLILKPTLSFSLTQLHLSNAISLSAPVSTMPVRTEILLHYYLSTYKPEQAVWQKKTWPKQDISKNICDAVRKKSTRASCIMNSVSVRLHQAKTEIQYVFILDIVKAYLKWMQIFISAW